MSDEEKLIAACEAKAKARARMEYGKHRNVANLSPDDWARVYKADAEVAAEMAAANAAIDVITARMTEKIRDKLT